MLFARHLYELVRLASDSDRLHALPTGRWGLFRPPYLAPGEPCNEIEVRGETLTIRNLCLLSPHGEVLVEPRLVQDLPRRPQHLWLRLERLSEPPADPAARVQSVAAEWCSESEGRAERDVRLGKYDDEALRLLVPPRGLDATAPLTAARGSLLASVRRLRDGLLDRCREDGLDGDALLGSLERVAIRGGVGDAVECLWELRSLAVAAAGLARRLRNDVDSEAAAGAATGRCREALLRKVAPQEELDALADREPEGATDVAAYVSDLGGALDRLRLRLRERYLDPEGPPRPFDRERWGYHYLLTQTGRLQVELGRPGPGLYSFHEGQPERLQELPLRGGREAELVADGSSRLSVLIPKNVTCQVRWLT